MHSYLEQCTMMYCDVQLCTLVRAAKIEAKTPQAITKGAQIKGREDLIIGGQNFQRASIAMLQI